MYVSTDWIEDQAVTAAKLGDIAGVGLGGGVGSKVDLDLTSLTLDTSVSASDVLAIHDGAHKKITFANFEGAIDHANLTNLNSANYTHLTAANHTDLTDGSDSTLHYHAADRLVSNHSGVKVDYNNALSDGNFVFVNGAFHDGFSDFVANEHINHTGVTLTAGSGLSGGGDISSNRSFALDINGLSADTSISATDTIPFYDGSNKKITFANFEGDISHDNLANITGTAGQYNHPTDANMTVLGNTSGTNTGDQSAGDFLHNSLSTKQGGTTDEYYHLTSAQHTIATQAANTTLSGYLTATDWDTFNDKQAALTFGIANTNSVVIDHASVVDNDYAKFTTSGLEGRSYAEVRTDLGLVIGTNVLAQQSIGIANDNLIETDSASITNGEIARFTANGLESRSNAEMKTQLGYMTDVSDDTSPTLAGTLVCADNHITGIGAISGTGELDLGSKSTSFSVDFSTDNNQEVIITGGSPLITLDTTYMSGVSKNTLKITNGGAGAVTWAAEGAATITWLNGGVAPTLVASGTEFVVFHFDGTNFWGSFIPA